MFCAVGILGHIDTPGHTHGCCTVVWVCHDTVGPLVHRTLRPYKACCSVGRLGHIDPPGHTHGCCLWFGDVDSDYRLQFATDLIKYEAGLYCTSATCF